MLCQDAQACAQSLRLAPEPCWSSRLPVVVRYGPALRAQGSSVGRLMCSITTRHFSGAIALPLRSRVRVASAEALEYCIPAMRTGARNPRPGSGRVQSPLHPAGAAVSPRVERIGSPDSYKSRAYAALKDAIVAMDVYRSRTDIRLDERRPALGFRLSRTPRRETPAP